MIFLWAWLGDRATGRKVVQELESALRQDEAREICIQATNAVEFEEVADEGACFAFEVAPYELMFVSGQEFYPSAKFPNTGFCLIYVYGESGDLVEFFIEKHGRKLRPARVISAATKAKLRVPANLECIPGTLDDLERILGA